MVCGGTTPGKQQQPLPQAGTGQIKGSNRWRKYGLIGVYIEVDTSQCNFSSTPQYSANLIGDQIWDHIPYFGQLNGLGGLARWVQQQEQQHSK
jgi:hypothetical protein